MRITQLVQALRRDYDDSEIGIILRSYLVEQMKEVRDHLRAFGIYTTRNTEDRESVLIVSPRQAKGYERKAIVFCTPPLEKSMEKIGKAIDVYVALTRARDRLIVLQV